MSDFNHDVERSLQVLNEGGVILYPTDTVWGLGCDATNDAAVENLVNLKGKEAGRGLIIIVGSERDVIKLVPNLDLAIFDFLAERQRPTTVIYPAGIGVADSVLAEDGSIAIRIVQDEFCRHLTKRLRRPIVSTSANFHGQPTASTFRQIDPILKKSVDYIVQTRQDDETVSPPSSIVKVLSGGKFQIIR